MSLQPKHSALQDDLLVPITSRYLSIAQLPREERLRATGTDRRLGTAIVHVRDYRRVTDLKTA